MARSAAAPWLGSEVEPDRGNRGIGRFEVLDDEALALVGPELVEVEVGLAVEAGGGDEGRLLIDRHPTHEAESAGAGKLAFDVLRCAVLGKAKPRDPGLAAGRDHGTAGAAQAVLESVHPGRHLLGRAPRHGIEAGLGQRPVVAGLPEGRARGHAKPDGQPRQRAQGLAQRHRQRQPRSARAA
jgi:hypothetical protein